MHSLRRLLSSSLLLATTLLAACGEDSVESTRRGCTPDHDATGTYRFSPAYLDERLLLLERSLRVEERVYDREALTRFVDGMREAWSGATLVLARDGTFVLSGVEHPEFGSAWRGTWTVHIDERECKLRLRSAGAELYALLGDGWTIPWAEKPQPGMVLDVQLVRDETDSE